MNSNATVAWGACPPQAEACDYQLEEKNILTLPGNKLGEECEY